MRSLIAAVSFAVACGGHGEPPKGPFGTATACRSRDECRARCARGETQACDGLVALVEHDGEGPRYGGRADSEYRLACRYGSANGCLSSALLHDRGLGMVADPTVAHRLFDRARDGFAAQCGDGFARGCYFEATMHLRALGAGRDDARARALAESGCQGDSGLACWLVWRIRAGEGDEAADVYAKAIERLDADCEAGQLDACDALERDRRRLEPPPAPVAEPGRSPAPLPGIRCTSVPADVCDHLTEFVVGIAVDVLDVFVAKLDRVGCDLGHERSCYELGLAELVGLGVDQDVAGGLARIRAACAAGEALACDAYGQGIARGLVPGRAPADAARYRARACDMGDPDACLGLGHAVFAADVLRGLALMDRACDLDLAEACATLGVIYFNGAGVGADRPRGLRLLRVGCLIGGPVQCALEQAHLLAPPSP